VNPRIKQIISDISSLEEELRNELHQQEKPLLFYIKGKRVEFEKAIRQEHRKLKMNVFRWITKDRPQNLITAPFIYGLVIPLVFLDMAVTLYQAVCFPIYRIKKVNRQDYISMDRQHLEYLNVFERFHCDYCGYANGLLAYVTEIAARTEQYFCPIKHAHSIIGTSRRYERFLGYGDADGYHAKLEDFRTELENENQPTPD
jgi:hypothetical protein